MIWAMGIVHLGSVIQRDFQVTECETDKLGGYDAYVSSRKVEKGRIYGIGALVFSIEKTW